MSDLSSRWDRVYQEGEVLAIAGSRIYRQRIMGIPLTEYERLAYNSGNSFLNDLGICKGKLLDIGCGSVGSIVIPASKRGLDVWGVDVSQVALKVLKERLCRTDSKAHLSCSNILEGLPFDNNSFDYVISRALAMQHLFLFEAKK